MLMVKGHHATVMPKATLDAGFTSRHAVSHHCSSLANTLHLHNRTVCGLAGAMPNPNPAQVDAVSASVLARLPHLRSLALGLLGSSSSDAGSSNGDGGATAWAALQHALRLASLRLRQLPKPSNEGGTVGWQLLVLIQVVELRGVELPATMVAAAAKSLPLLKLLTARPTGVWGPITGAAAFPHVTRAAFTWQDGFEGVVFRGGLLPSLQQLVLSPRMAGAESRADLAGVVMTHRAEWADDNAWPPIDHLETQP